ncbi:MAG TPA: ribose 5-phosphate isomerase B [Syntrophobacteraceae bacterium]|jgi:ribose 5-phosphate isomerase B|nr:ribose 5-phosphate isomerase B [Syntrophobacteraceae bacterium]
MKVVIAGDHAGFRLKQFLVEQLQRDGLEVLDLGCNDESPSDYPDFAREVGAALSTGRAERGVLVCGSGVGASVAANKIKGVRAGLCHDVYSAHQGVEHDDMNVICLGSRVVGTHLALEIVRTFLGASFSYEDRHVRRLHKVIDIERLQR